MSGSVTARQVRRILVLIFLTGMPISLSACRSCSRHVAPTLAMSWLRAAWCQSVRRLRRKGDQNANVVISGDGHNITRFRVTPLPPTLYFASATKDDPKSSSRPDQPSLFFQKWFCFSTHSHLPEPLGHRQEPNLVGRAGHDLHHLSIILRTVLFRNVRGRTRLDNLKVDL